MKAIYKYPLPVQGDVTVKMPMGALVLTVQVQRGTICMWALVEPGNPLLDYKFSIYGTGFPFDYYGRYIGTVQTEGGQFVWHVFQNTLP